VGGATNYSGLRPFAHASVCWTGQAQAWVLGFLDDQPPHQMM
jgi:hypothetical protein